MASIKTFTFAVASEGSHKLYFPLDMLRRDKCWPSSFDDVLGMASGSPGLHKDGCIWLDSHKQPNPEHWKTYGWYIVGVDWPENTIAVLSALTSQS